MIWWKTRTHAHILAYQVCQNGFDKTRIQIEERERGHEYLFAREREALALLVDVLDKLSVNVPRDGAPRSPPSRKLPQDRPHGPAVGLEEEEAARQLLSRDREDYRNHGQNLGARCEG